MPHLHKKIFSRIRQWTLEKIETNTRKILNMDFFILNSPVDFHLKTIADVNKEERKKTCVLVREN
jgi:hypothetical protein